MSNAFIGEIRPFGFTFAPVSWAFCDGQLMPIAQNSTLFAVIGTTYGGDGQSTFALPDLRGRATMHQGTGPNLTTRVIGQAFGTPNVTLTPGQMPAHAHTINAAQAAPNGTGLLTGTPGSTVLLSNSGPGKAWHGEATPPPYGNFSNKAISTQGNSLPHDNMQPFLAVNFCIALEGVFPSQG